MSQLQQAAGLPATVRVGLYEEFPNPWRLAKLSQVDFPVTLAIAAQTRVAFEDMQTAIRGDYPQVREIFFWPLLKPEEGYYPGPFSQPSAIRRVIAETTGVPVLWDLETPPNLKGATPAPWNWWENQRMTGAWLRTRTQPVHIWRSHAALGLNPMALRLIGLHYDPLDYPAVSLHLDLYTTGAGQPEQSLRQLITSGVARYGSRFIPSLGVLNDGEGSAEQFIYPETLRRNLRIARECGASQIWLFGVNGLNEAYLRAAREELPLEKLA